MMIEIDLNQVDVEANCLIGKLYGTNIPAEGFVIVTVCGVRYKVYFHRSYTGWILTRKEKYEKIDSR